MPKKNNPTPKNSINDNKPFKASKRKSLSAAIMMTAGVLSSNLGYSQSSNPSFLKDTKNTSTELVEKNDSIEHQKIINTNVDSLLMEYGQEKGMEMIREHMLIEINKVRKEFNDSILTKNDADRRIKPITLNTKLSKAAQDYAIYMYDNNRYEHKGKDGSTFESRIQATGYPFDYYGENLFHPEVFTPTIQKAIIARKGSTGHHRIMNGKHFLHVGIGYYKGYRVTDFGGPR